ncbi:MAG: hypothetical protein DRN33_01645 [Thermoplasmata archaeon]|nr:MAG: hypothetical protein FE043_03870 [Thermoplasmata archaeon]RLF64653.1 MAG: hypothetical protein DRN33_01645 [Thermoplasmata archaeon]
MRKKLISLIICSLFLVVSLPPSLADSQEHNDLPNGLCITRGFFEYKGEDENYTYFKAIYAAAIFFMSEKGTGFALLVNSDVKFSKPFHSISLSVDNYTFISWGLCENWDFS